MSPDDPFGTAALRRRVLDAWTASPARFREDANAEEDQALGGYRDRLVVELAQNAADAAARAGVPGRLLLELTDPPEGRPVLVAANTGAPLDAVGVESLATLRASAKRDPGQGDPAAQTVGRFGVGFAATLAVTDEPALRSTTGGARWSRAATVGEVSAVPSLAAELARREGHVPVLRLPWADDAPPPAGFDSAVVLPLRDASALDLVRRQLALVGPALLLMLPALSEVVVRDGADERVVRAADLHVRRVDAGGPLDPELLRDRPTEERQTGRWWVSWAHPRPEGTEAVLHAPTPTDERVDLPALLLGGFPLEPSRRHVARGPLYDVLVGRAAEAYVDLVRQVARDDASGPDDVLALVPGPVGVGALDADLRAAITAGLADAAVLPGGLTPGDAVAVDGLPAATFDLLADAVEGLLPPAWSAHRSLDRLGVRRLRLADLVDDLAGLDRAPLWWRGLYGTLEGADREALSGLPVPLADGRLVRGVRGAVLPAASGPSAEGLAALGFRVVHPDAAHTLLESLGAVPGDPWLLLGDPVVEAAVTRSEQADDPHALAEAVLALVADVRPQPGERPWLASLALPDDEGVWTAAGELLLPGGAVAGLVEAGELGSVDVAWVDRWGAAALVAVGVLDRFGVVRDEDVSVDPDLADHDLDGEDDWLVSILDALEDQGLDLGDEGLPPVLREMTALRDLDLVRDDAWPDALRLIAGDPVLRASVVERGRVVLPDGRSAEIEPYTAWWLRNHRVLGDRKPSTMRSPAATALAGLLDSVPDVGLDDAFLAAIGVVTSAAQVVGSPQLLQLLRVGLLRAGRGSGPVDAESGAGEVRPVPELAARVLSGRLPSTYLEHDELLVAGHPVEWWVDDDGTVRAATLDGVARGLAWAAGEWSRRHVLAAVLAEPGRVNELLAETAWDDRT